MERRAVKRIVDSCEFEIIGKARSDRPSTARNVANWWKLFATRALRQIDIYTAVLICSNCAIANWTMNARHDWCKKRA